MNLFNGHSAFLKYVLPLDIRILVSCNKNLFCIYFAECNIFIPDDVRMSDETSAIKLTIQLCLEIIQTTNLIYILHNLFEVNQLSSIICDNSKLSKNVQAFATQIPICSF